MELERTQICIADQRLVLGLADPLHQAAQAYQSGCNGRVFPIDPIPSHQYAAQDIDLQIEVGPDTTNIGGLVGNLWPPAVAPGRAAGADGHGHYGGIGRSSWGFLKKTTSQAA